MEKCADINEEDVDIFLNQLNHNMETEVRAIKLEGTLGNEKRVVQSHFKSNNRVDIFSFIKNFVGKRNIYIGCHERQIGGTEKIDVISVENIFIDIDARIKPASEEDLIETKKIAYNIIDEIEKRTGLRGTIIMSGNGYQLLLKISKIYITETNRIEIETKIKTFISALKKKYDNNKIKLDQVGDLARIMRVPGVINIKGGRLAIIEEYNNIPNQKLLEYILSLEILKNVNLTDVSSALEILEKYGIDKTDMWIYEMIKDSVLIRPGTGRNDIVLKNVAIVCERERLNENEKNTVALVVFNSCKDSNLATFNGWIKKVKDNKLISVNKNEINKFIRENIYPLAQYNLTEEDKEKNREYYEKLGIEKIKNRISEIVTSNSEIKRKNTENILKDLVDYDMLVIDELLNLIKEKTKYSNQVLKQKLRSLKDKRNDEIYLKGEINSNYREFSDLCNEVLSLIVVGKASEATEIICQEIEKREHIYITRDDEKSEVWIYREGIYVPNGKSYIKEFCRKILGQAYTPHLANGVLGKIETDTYINAKDFFVEHIIDEIPVKNGILNIFTKKLSNFTPDKRFFTKLPVKYIESKDCPKIKKFLGQIHRHDEDVFIIQELFGYLLLRDYRIEKALMLNGNGRNGKGRLLELIKRFLGPENCVNIPLQDIEKDSFALSELQGKLANISGDISKEALKNTGNFKLLTGEDIITANRKFKVRISFTNYAKQVYSSNELPSTYDLTDAFFLRWILLDYPFKFLSQKELDLIEEKERKIIINGKPKYNLADKEIVRKIVDEDELSGLLNWSLEGLHKLLEKRDFSYSKSMEDVKREWILKSDNFKAFCTEMIEKDDEGIITKEELRKEYSNYCDKHKVIAVGDRSIKETLTRNYAVVESQKTVDLQNPENFSNSRKVSYVWLGIKLKKTEKNE